MNKRIQKKNYKRFESLIHELSKTIKPFGIIWEAEFDRLLDLKGINKDMALKCFIKKFNNKV